MCWMFPWADFGRGGKGKGGGVRCLFTHFAAAAAQETAQSVHIFQSLIATTTAVGGSVGEELVADACAICVVQNI